MPVAVTGRDAHRLQEAGWRDKWRLSVLDLATMRETPLAETGSVDDQAEWLDADNVLYGLNGDVWRVRADGSGSPSLYLADALSPSVARVGSHPSF